MPISVITSTTIVLIWFKGLKTLIMIIMFGINITNACIGDQDRAICSEYLKSSLWLESISDQDKLPVKRDGKQVSDAGRAGHDVGGDPQLAKVAAKAPGPGDVVNQSERHDNCGHQEI